MIISSADEPIIRFRLPKILLTFSFFSVCAGILILTAFSYHYHQTNQKLNQHASELNEQVDEKDRRIETLKQQVKVLHDEAEAVQEKLAELENLEHQLRAITDLPKEQSIQSSSLNNAPMGGAPVHIEADEGDSDADKAIEDFQYLSKRLPELIHQYENTIKDIEAFKAELRITPTIWPTSARRITSTFGYRKDPFNGIRSKHTGIDIAGSWGTPIYATADGTVTLAEYDNGYGRSIVIRHSPKLSTRYGHMSSLIVSAGDKVKKGQKIGYMGSTGRSTGVHLHYEVLKYGTPVDPYPYLPIKR